MERDLALHYFMSQGWTQPQAAGIVANLMRESSLDPSSVGDSGQAYGIAQWHPDRQAQFQKVFGKPIQQSTLQEQLQFVHHELTQGAERPAGLRLRRTQTAAEASAAVAKYYERPANLQQEMAIRANMAEPGSAAAVPQPVAPVTRLFPGEDAMRRSAAGDLFPKNNADDALRTSVTNQTPVDKANRIYQLQLQTGLPTGLIERNLDQLEAVARQKNFDPEKFRQESPLLAKWLATDPNRAALAQGDYENLSMIEKAWRTIQAIPPGAEQGFEQNILMGDLNFKAVMGTITPQEEIQRKELNTHTQALQQGFEYGAPSWVFQAANLGGMLFGSTLQALQKGATQGLPLGAAAGAALGAIGGPGAPVSVPAGAAAGGMIGLATGTRLGFIENTYKSVVGESYMDLENATDAHGNHIDPTAARYAALLVGAPNALLEFASLEKAGKLVGVDKLAAKLGTTEAVKQLLLKPSVMAAMKDFSKKYAAAVGTESFTEGFQQFLTIVSREIATGDLGANVNKADVQSVIDNAVMAFKGTAVLGLLPAGPHVVQAYHDVQVAERNQAFMEELGGIAKQSKTLANSPAAFQDYVSALKQDGPIKNVYIPVEQWDAIFKDQAPAVAKEVLGNLDSYAEAKATGGDLTIPMETYASKLAATDFHQSLLQNSRFHPNEMTPAEAQQFVQQEPELMKGLQQQVEEQQAKEAPLKAIYSDVYQKLRDIGTSPQEANRDALLWQERLRSRAERLGIDPLKLYQENPLNVQRDFNGEIAKQLNAYEQQLAEPPVANAQRLPLGEGKMNLPPATEQEKAAAQEAVASAQSSFENYGVFGATIHPQRGNLAGQEGVAVAGYPQRGVITEGAPTAKDLETFLQRNRDIFKADKNAALGVWVDNESGKGYIDITNVLPRELAIAQGEKLGELALWDLGNSEEIRLPVQRETGQGVLFQPAFHGTPFKFDKFSLEHLGKGEGAQVYGWGLYFASKRSIAEWYRENLTSQKVLNPSQLTTVDGIKLKDYLQGIYDARRAAAERDGTTKPSALAMAKIMAAFNHAAPNVDAVLEQLRNEYTRLINANTAAHEQTKNMYNDAAQIVEGMRGKKIEQQKVEPNKGQLYKVDIPEGDYLDWDKPLSEQPESVKEAIKPVLGTDKTVYRAPDGDLTILTGLPEKEIKAYQKLHDKQIGKIMTMYDALVELNATGGTIYKEIANKFARYTDGQREASQYLNSYGIPGIQYLDNTSRGGKGDTHNYVVFDDKAINILETYYQGERGAAVPAKNLIALLKNADPSTFVHESGHLWLEELRQDALRRDAPAQLVKDWETVKAWTGATDLIIPRDAHEKFARGIEAYVMEGKAPSFELREIFSQLKDWLVKIYKSMTMLDVQLTPEVRDVMDRLIATDEAIKQSRESNGYHVPLLDQSMLTPEEYAAYRKLNETAKLQAEDAFRVKVMKELRREKLDSWRQEKAALAVQARKDVLDIPIYKAAYWLWSGLLPDGSKIEGMDYHKLDKQALLNMGVTLSDLPFRYQENGVHPDVVAQLFGFPSGETLVKNLIGLPTLKQAIDEQVDFQMKQQHGDMLFDGSLQDKADMEVQNTQQIDVFNMEMKILKRMGARREMSHPAILKDIARQIIDRKVLKDIDPKYFENAALKAGQDAQAALLGQEFRHGTGRNLEVAFDAKQRQMLNTFLAKEAAEQKAMIEKTIKAWEKVLFRPDAKLGKTRDMNMVNAARAIAAAHGVGGASDSALAFMEQMKLYDEQSYTDMIDIVSMVTANAKPVDELTLADFNVVKDSIDGLWALARRSRQVLIDGQHMERQDIIDQLNGRITELIVPGKDRAGYRKAMTDWDKTKMGLVGAMAGLRRVEPWVDAMDNGDPNGVFRRFVWNPISEASNLYRDQRRVFLERYMDIAKELPEDAMHIGKIDAPEIGYEFGSKAELIATLMHTGNQSSLQKLLIGGRGDQNRWGVFTPSGDLDSTRWDAFIKRAQDQGILTKADYDFVQKIWDLFETLKPEAQQAHKEMYGYYFNEITARPFTTPFGDYRGGYYPAIADPYLVEDAAIRGEQAALESRPSSFMFPSTGRGFTFERVEGYNRPLALNLGLIPQHIEKVLRFTYLEPRVKDIGRIIINKDFRAMLSNLDSEVGAIMLNPWLQRAALQQTEMPSGPRMQAFDKFFHNLRANTGLQIMAGSISNALQQFTGIPIAMTQVKPRYIAGALNRYISAPRDYAAMITDASVFMRNRNATQSFEVQKAIDNILLDKSKYQKAKDFAQQHGYFLQVGSQNIVDLIAWGGAYEQAMANGADQKSAVRQADSVVRETQGSFAPEDISRIEAGKPFTRVFTMFYSYFNMLANLMGTEFVKAMRMDGYAAGGRALYIYTMGFMIPAVLSEAIAQAISGELFDDSDDDGYLDNLLSVFFGGQVKMATAMVPVLGQVAQVAINEFNSKWYDDHISASPAVSALEATARVPNDAFKLATEENARAKRPIQDTLTMIGLATGMPIAPLGRPLGYIADVQQGYTEPSGPVDMARGLISGRTPR